MPRFSDQWVVDRTMFEFVSGSGCACCGFPSFLPGGVESMIKEVSDLETDAADQEIAALAASPWPPEIRDQVWADRLRLRHKMKREMKAYAEFWESHDGDDFCGWLQQSVPAKVVKKLLQMPRSEVTTLLNQKYNIHTAFVQVVNACVEQVAHFEATGYPTDAPSNATVEVAFEQALGYDRRGGFTLNVCDADGNLDTQVLNVWMQEMKSLGGPKLLDRATKKEKKDSDDDDDDDGADDVVSSNRQTSKIDGPSFRSDRRIVRLLIARYWADHLIKKYKATKEEQTEDETESQQVDEKQ